MTPPEDSATPTRVRALGSLKAVAGLAGTAALWPLGLIKLLGRLMDEPVATRPDTLVQLLIFAMSMPAVLFMIGLWEMASGRPFRLLESRWDKLKEWQQGVLSFLLLCLAIGLLFVVLQVISGVRFL